MPDLNQGPSKQTFATGAQRDTAENKPRPDLISPFFMFRVGQHLAKGAEHYGERNWEQGIPMSRCLASLERHIQQYKLGLTNEDHLAAIGCNIVFLIHYDEMIKAGMLPPELEDLPFYLQPQSDLHVEA